MPLAAGHELETSYLSIEAADQRLVSADQRIVSSASRLVAGVACLALRVRRWLSADRGL